MENTYKNYGPLFNAAKPASRAGDSYTSDLAEEKVTKSGIRQQQCRVVYELLQKHNGFTSKELAKISKLDRYMIARRLPDLLGVGKVRKGQKRQCGVAHTLADTWFTVN